jgi:hypothetical protein
MSDYFNPPCPYCHGADCPSNCALHKQYLRELDDLANEIGESRDGAKEFIKSIPKEEFIDARDRGTQTEFSLWIQQYSCRNRAERN